MQNLMRTGDCNHPISAKTLGTMQDEKGVAKFSVNW